MKSLIIEIFHYGTSIVLRKGSHKRVFLYFKEKYSVVIIPEKLNLKKTIIMKNSAKLAPKIS